MKRLFSVICSLLLILTITSCGNINAGKADASKGSIRFGIARDAASTGSTPESTFVEATSYRITLYSINSSNNETAYTGFPKNYSAAEVDAGIQIDNLPVGNYKIKIEAFNGTLIILSATSEVFAIEANKTTEVTLSGSVYAVCLSNGQGGSMCIGAFSEQFPSSFKPYEFDVDDWGPEGMVLIGWTGADGVTYERDEDVDLRGKALPYKLTAIWGSPTVSYTFNSNYTDGPDAVTTNNFTRWNDLTISEYQRVNVYEDLLSGVFNDDKFVINGAVDSNNIPTGDEMQYLDDADGRYYFCGWSVGVHLPMLKGGTGADANYDKALLKNVKIVQPGEKFKVKEDTTFYAVWAREDLLEEKKILDVRYQWGDSRASAVLDEYDGTDMWVYNIARYNYHTYYLVDNIRTDVGTGYDSYQIPLTMPSVESLFPQYADLPEDIEKEDRWDNQSYKAAGSTFLYATAEAAGKYTIKFPVKIPLIRFHNQGSLYSDNEEKEYIQYYYSFPLPEELELFSYGTIPGFSFAPLYYENANSEGDSIYERSDIWFNNGTGDPEDKVSIFAEEIEEAKHNEYVAASYVTSHFDGPVWEDWVYTLHTDRTSLPLDMYVDWELNAAAVADIFGLIEGDVVIYSLDDVRKVASEDSNLYLSSCGSWDDFKAGDADYASRYYCLGKSLLLEELTEPLFSETFTGKFFGLNNAIAVENGQAPIFTEIGAEARVENLRIIGNFGDYNMPSRDVGVLCSGNYGEIYNCTFEGSASGVKSIFGYQANYATHPETKIIPGSDTGTIPAFDSIIRIAMIPFEGDTVTYTINSTNSAFKNSGVQVNSFLMANTDLTYEKWYEVFQWATSEDRVAEGRQYTFKSYGKQGTGGTNGDAPVSELSRMPATTFSWRDAVIWCNAASEMEGLTPAYWVEGTTDFTDTTKVLRVSENVSSSSGYYGTISLSDNEEYKTAKSGSADRSVTNPNADGYRLPTLAEYEYAARGGNQYLGAWSWDWPGTGDSGQLADFAVFNGNSLKSVGTKKPNIAGLYDMVGNLGEFIYEVPFTNTTGPYVYGGSFNTTTADTCRITNSTAANPASAGTRGFHPVRSIISGN